MDEEALERSRHGPRRFCTCPRHGPDGRRSPTEKEAAGMGAPGPHTTAESTHSLVRRVSHVRSVVEIWRTLRLRVRYLDKLGIKKWR